mmetsp:Transcript_12932/g.14848  ORF Transcript_12932/g.14848 Transcript_12932/m.14848 type:complete len:242 (+) Transcript_12932:1773-2498(+)
MHISISSNVNNQIVYVEDNYTKKTIYVIDEANFMDVSFDFDIKFHYPYIFYGYEKNEIWAQHIDKPQIINRYVFVNTITAFDNTDDVYFGYNYLKEPQTLGLILSYENHHKIASFKLSDSGAILRRIQKPIKFSELPNASIISFCQIIAMNDKNVEEPCVMFHYLNQLKFYYMKTGKIKKSVEKRYAIRNVIPYVDRLFFWEDRGRVIERLEIPIQKDEKTLLHKVYDAKNNIKLCKKTVF